MRLQVLEASIKRSYVDGVSLGDKMREHFFGASGVSRAFAVDSVENGRH
jgi:hypothetical protein